MTTTQTIALISPHRCPTRAQVVAWLKRNGWRSGTITAQDTGPLRQTYYHSPDGSPAVSDADAYDSADWTVEIPVEDCRYSWPDAVVDAINEIADMIAARAGDIGLSDPGALCEEMLKDC